MQSDSVRKMEDLSFTCWLTYQTVSTASAAQVEKEDLGLPYWLSETQVLMSSSIDFQAH